MLSIETIKKGLPRLVERPQYSHNPKKGLVWLSPEPLPSDDAISAAALEADREQLLADLNAHRWAVEGGGIETSFGAQVGTKRADQALILQTIESVERYGQADDTVPLILSDGTTLSVSLAEIQVVGREIYQHVRHCTEVGAALAAEIRVLPAAELADYDIAARWEAMWNE